MEKESQTIFEKNVIEFVTVAAEFCAFLERAEHMKRKAFVDTSLKICDGGNLRDSAYQSSRADG